MIELEHINKVFESDAGCVHAVRDVSLSIGSGEIFGIVGFSGAGKSTLVRCINLLERPTAGTVKVNGQELTRLSGRELRAARKKVGMIFQHFCLMRSRTVFGNVAYPLRRNGLTRQETAEKVRQLLELVGIADRERAYPAQLSGGQQQRVAIARALATDPDVLLCDEATSALDPKTTRSILQLLSRLNAQLGITIVLITHEMAVVREICHRVAVMECGKVVEQGDVFSIFARPQQAVTREFMRTASNLYRIDAMLEQDAPTVRLKHGERMVRLTYVQRNVSEPIISAVSRLFDVDVNILFADIEMVQGAPVGGTVAVIRGGHEQIKQALAYWAERGVEVEVLADAGMAE